MTANVNTYNGLVQAITDWVNRNDPTFIANIPLFISLAEQVFFYDCPTLGTQVYEKGTFNPNSGIIPKPALWGQTLSFSYLDSANNVNVMQRVSYEYIRSWVPNNNTITPANGTYTTSAQDILPRYYTDYGYNYFLISPKPIIGYTYELAYLTKAQPLSLSNQTNWITQYAYDALFYLSLSYAYRFIDNQPDADLWQQQATTRIQSLVSYHLGQLVFSPVRPSARQPNHRCHNASE